MLAKHLVPCRKSSVQSHAKHTLRDAEDVPSGQGKPAAVRLVPAARRVTWDGPRRLMFTPPGSIAVDNRPRWSTCTQSEPSTGQRSQTDAPGLHLPPLTPLPPGEPAASAQPATHAVPDVSLAAATLQVGSSSNLKQLITPAGDLGLSQHLMIALSPSRQKSGVAAAPCTPPPPAAIGLHTSARTPPQLSEAISRSRRQQQLSSSVPSDSAGADPATPDSNKLAQGSAACADCSGPPITRMRPSAPAAASTAGRKPVGKAQGSTVSTADDLLLNAVLCGWEEDNDGVSRPFVTEISMIICNVYT